MTPDKYKPYIFNVSWDKQSPRGARLLELLDADPSITKEEAIEYTLNVYDILAKPWQAALTAASAGGGAPRLNDPEIAETVKAILEWDGLFVKDCTICTVVKFWRLKCETAIDVEAVVNGKPLNEAGQAKMIDLLAETLAELKVKYGSASVKWGDIHRIGRGGKYFPCNGADFGGGKDKCDFTETVLDVSSHEEQKGSGQYIAFNGSGSLMISFLHKDGIESYSLVAWGQNGDPNSPHYVDQSEKLYSERKMKPTWFKKEDLLENVESEKTLDVP